MSNAIQAPSTAAAGAYQLSPTPLGLDGTQVLYTLWKNVFASSHDLAGVRDDSQAAPAGAGVSQDFAGSANRSGAHGEVAGGADHRHLEAESTLEAQRLSASRNADTQSRAARAMVIAKGSDAGTLPEPMTEVENSPGMLLAEIQGSSAPPLLSRSPGAAAEPISEPRAAWATDIATATAGAPRMVEETSLGEATGPTVADSVNVFVYGSAVAIVVRDSSIPDHEAVHCAFETARTLTGQRTGLARLTLNGRILYQQPIQAPADRRPASAALAFAC